ncbi:hypothetical protein MPLDJ20_320053 [Mesorhizobium plurifarium]|uniref:Uncharacterized protein n=1 Tax=Mesorhizobium plurifarium TaxID=69974 RepID=A0A090GNS0_MESPL|nr:hypothetical protein MPLDJ20_320053 [Mesorhizobium plurifarium]
MIMCVQFIGDLARFVAIEMKSKTANLSRVVQSFNKHLSGTNLHSGKAIIVAELKLQF